MSEAALTEAITDGHAEIDGIAEDQQTRYLGRLKELLENPKSRNIRMWTIFGVDKYLIPMTKEDIEKKNRGLRDDVWRQEFAGLMAACIAQARVEIIFRDTAKVAETTTRRKEMAARNMDRGDLKRYASTTRRRADFDAARQRRLNGKDAKTTNQ